MTYKEKNALSQQLAAALIVRNAEATLETSIASIRSICSQIVVVDTGSTDSTQKIAARMGSEIHFYKWTDDFSAARNYALQFVRRDWTIVLDADEELDSDSLEGLAGLLNNPKNGGILVSIENFLGKNDDTLKKNTLENNSAKNDFTQHVVAKHNYTRIFRNKPNIRFNGIIHEQIAVSIENAGYIIAPSELQVFHYGYQSNDINKSIRNIMLLNSELSRNPDDPWIRYHLGETHFAAGDFHAAKTFFITTYNSISLTDAQRELSRIRLAQIALKNNKIRQVLNFLDFTSNDIDREGFRVFIKTTAKLLEGGMMEAADVSADNAISYRNEIAELIKLSENPALLNSRMIEPEQLKILLETISHKKKLV